jgi:G2/mitotic-specific cyclin 2
VHDENKVQHTRMTRSKLASSTDLASLSTTALPSKVGNNKAGPAATRKRAALGDVTNAHKKGAPLGDITNAVLKKPTTDKATTVPAKRPISRKPSVVNVKKAAAAPPMTTTTTVTTLTTTTVVESKPLASKQNAQITNGPSVVIPKKRPSEAVAPTTKRGSENVAPRRTLKQSTSTSSFAQKGMIRTTSRRRAEEPAEPEAPRKKQKVEPVQDWDDLDAADANDPFMVSEYVNEIFDYMRVLEVFYPSQEERLTCSRSNLCRIPNT